MNRLCIYILYIYTFIYIQQSQSLEAATFMGDYSGQFTRESPISDDIDSGPVQMQMKGIRGTVRFVWDRYTDF